MQKRNDGEGDKNLIGDDDKEPYKFSIVSSFNSEIAVSSVPQTFIVSTDNSVVTLISTLGDDQRAFHVNPIAGDEALTASSQVITLKQLDDLHQSNEAHDKSVKNPGEYRPLVNEITLQPDQSGNHHLLPESAINQLQVAEVNESCQMKVEDTLVQFREDITSMVLRDNQVVPPGHYDSINTHNANSSEKYFFLESTDEVEEAIRKHTEETFSHFVVAKKTKAYGSIATTIDTNSKFRIHWQSRDLTSTEECAVQIPFQGVPFIYIGEKAYMCHLGRNKSKSKVAVQAEVQANLLQTKRHRSRLTKKQGCPAKIFVKQIAKFPGFRIPCNSEYLRTQMSQKLRKAIMDSNGQINHVIQYVGTLPDISEHSNHDIGENTPVKEPIDPLIRDKIVELSWKFGENALPKEIKELLDQYVCEIFKGRDPPSKHRRRFYPSERDIANYIYKSRLLSKFTCGEQEQIHVIIDVLRSEYPDDKFISRIEIDNHFPIPVEFVEGGRVVKNTINNLSPSNDQKFLFVFQSCAQQRLLKLYGKQAILTEISKQFSNLPFPFYGVFVPTNVDYQLVHTFIVQSRSLDYLRQGLTPLLEWNLSWTPKFFIVDFCHEQISIIEELFPSCSVLISDLSREESWSEWLEDPENSASLQGNKDQLHDRLSAIANSFTEETLNLAAQNLENSEEWRLSESLRDWFSSDWLAEVKRWVSGYRHDEFMSTLHIDAKLADDISGLRESHSTHLKNKKMPDFISYLIKVVIPACYQRYVEKNVSSYRAQYFLRNTQTEIPAYLENKTDSVTTYVLQQMKEAKDQEYTVNQVQTGIFWILDKADAETTYAVAFGDSTSLPSCVCIDWLKYKLPCKHMVSVFQKVLGWGWDMVSSLYTSNPILSLDFSCIDTEHEDMFLANWKKEECVKSYMEAAHVQILNAKEKVLNNEKPNGNSLVNITYPIPMKSPSSYLNHVPNITDSDSIGDDNAHIVNTLATECDNFCQELSKSIHQVGDHNILQKVKLELQMMLNDVKLELSKSSTKPTKRISSSDANDTYVKKVKCDTNMESNMPRLLDNPQSTDIPDKLSTGTTSKPEDYVQLISITNQTKPFSPKYELTPTFVTRTDFSPKLTSEPPENNDVWIFDPELNIKLLKVDRANILCGQPLSLEILKSVQNILKHQFSDVDGLCDPEKLATSGMVVECFSSKKKVLQLHMLEGNHWSASARTSQDVRIFCCTISSKATVIEQVLKMTQNNSFGDNILFIERIEEEQAVENCSLYAIAYSVAFLFDIEARNFLFAESEMRSHLAECLEDMCFSMFPVRTL